MTDRLAELLLKGVRSLPPAEQDEVLAVLLRGAVPSGTPSPPGSPGILAPPGTGALARRRAPDAPGGPLRVLHLGDRREWWTGPPPAGTRNAIGGGEEALKVLPVRIPAADYERLRAFSREHGFSMAVIVRTLVERFLAAQARRRAWRDDDEPDEPTTAGHA